MSAATNKDPSFATVPPKCLATLPEKVEAETTTVPRPPLSAAPPSPLVTVESTPGAFALPSAALAQKVDAETVSVPGPVPSPLLIAPPFPAARLVENVEVV